MINFNESVRKGKAGERIFKEDFLEHLRIDYKDVTGCQRFQAIDADIWGCVGGLYEVKNNYKDNGIIVIEDYTDYRPEFGMEIRKGWFYTSKANIFIFVSEITRNMILMPNTQRLRDHYEKLKTQYALKQNDYSFDERNGNKWRSGYHKIPFHALSGFIAFYKKISGADLKLF